MEIEPFDVDSIPANCRILLVGKTGAGKSTKMAWIMRTWGKKIRKGLVMSGSACNDYTYVPAAYRHRGYDAELIHKIRVEQDSRATQKEFDPTMDNSLWLILDDLSGDKTVMSDKSLKELFSMGRHGEISTVVMCQYLMDLPKALRTNVDYIILLADKSPSNRKALKEQFVSCVSQSTFGRIMDSCTQNKGALVINNRTDSNSPQDVFSHLRIPDREFVRGDGGKMRLPDFDIGHASYREYSKRHFYDREREKQKSRVEERLRKKRRADRKSERLHQLQCGMMDARVVSTIGSDYKSSIVTADTRLGSEPVMVSSNIVRHGIEIDTFSENGGGASNWPEQSARSF